MRLERKLQRRWRRGLLLFESLRRQNHGKLAIGGSLIDETISPLRLERGRCSRPVSFCALRGQDCIRGPGQAGADFQRFCSDFSGLDEISALSCLIEKAAKAEKPCFIRLGHRFEELRHPFAVAGQLRRLYFQKPRQRILLQ